MRIVLARALFCVAPAARVAPGRVGESTGSRRRRRGSGSGRFALRVVPALPSLLCRRQGRPSLRPRRGQRRATQKPCSAAVQHAFLSRASLEGGRWRRPRRAQRWTSGSNAPHGLRAPATRHGLPGHAPCADARRLSENGATFYRWQRQVGSRCGYPGVAAGRVWHDGQSRPGCVDDGPPGPACG